MVDSESMNEKSAVQDPSQFTIGRRRAVVLLESLIFFCFVALPYRILWREKIRDPLFDLTLSRDVLLRTKSVLHELVHTRI